MTVMGEFCFKYGIDELNTGYPQHMLGNAMGGGIILLRKCLPRNTSSEAILLGSPQVIGLVFSHVLQYALLTSLCGSLLSSMHTMQI